MMYQVPTPKNVWTLLTSTEQAGSATLPTAVQCQRRTNLDFATTTASNIAPAANAPRLHIPDYEADSIIFMAMLEGGLNAGNRNAVWVMPAEDTSFVCHVTSYGVSS